jgi:hypothetical protein
LLDHYPGLACGFDYLNRDDIRCRRGNWLSRIRLLFMLDSFS